MADRITATNPRTGEIFRWNTETNAFELESGPGDPIDFDAGQMVSNLGPSAMALAEDTARAFVHPIQTAQGLANVGQGIAARLIPGQQDADVMGDAVIGLLVDRFGGIENLQRTAQTDPVGLLGDVAGLLMGAGAAASRAPGMAGRVGRAAQRVGATIDPTNIAAQAAATGVTAIPGSRRLAQTLMQSSLRPPTSRAGNPQGAQARAQRVVDTALRERIVPGDRGVGRAQRLVDDIGRQIDDLIDNAPEGSEIRVRDILDSLDEEFGKADVRGDPRRGRTGQGFENVREGFLESVIDRDELETLNRAIAEADTPEARLLARQQKGQRIAAAADESLTVPEAQEAKRRIGERLNFEAGQGSTTFERERGEQAVRRGMRASLEREVPEIGELNARQSALLELQDPLGQAATRIGNRTGFSLFQPLGLAAGFTAGGPGGGALGLALGSMANPTVQGNVAVFLQRLIDQGIRPDIASRVTALLGAQGLRGAGRAGDQEALQSPEAAARFVSGRNARNR